MWRIFLVLILHVVVSSVLDMDDIFGLPDNVEPCVNKKDCYRQRDGAKWTVGIFKVTERRLSWRNDTGNLPNFLCTGTLIHPEVVLTTAHCVSKYKKDRRKLLRIRVGDAENVGVKNVVLHPEYSGISLKNDIALVLLTQVPFSNVTVCLPTPRAPLLNATCDYTTLQDREFNGTGNTKGDPVTLASHKGCEDHLQEILEPYFHFDAQSVCGFTLERSATKGDGGAPLVCIDPETSAQKCSLAGLLTWGYENVVVFVNVTQYRPWIQEELTLLLLNVEALLL